MNVRNIQSHSFKLAKLASLLNTSKMNMIP